MYGFRTDVAGHVARGQRPFVRQCHAVPGTAPGPQTGGRGRLLHKHINRDQVADGRLVGRTVHAGRHVAGRVPGARARRPAAAAAHQLAGLHDPAHFHEGKRYR